MAVQVLICDDSAMARKQLAKTVLAELKAGQAVGGHDCSTNGLINYYLEKSRT